MKYLAIVIAVLLLGSSNVHSQDAPNFVAKDIEGKEHSLYRYLESGKFVLLDFFASYWGTCARLVSSFNDIYSEYGENKQNLVVIGISLKPEDDKAKVEEFKKKNGGKYPEIEGKTYGAEIFSKYKSVLGDGFPNLCLINPEKSLIVWHEKGFKSFKELDEMLKKNGVEKNMTSTSNSTPYKNNGEFSILYINNNRIAFSALNSSSNMIKLFSLNGNQIISQNHKSQYPGLQIVNLNKSVSASGTYVVYIENDLNKISKRITLSK